MANPIDLERLEEGPESWNTWARELLARRKKFEANGTWEAKKGSWRREAITDFENFTFSSVVNFSDYIFPDIAKFEGATFAEEAHFNNTVFTAGAAFRRVHFAKLVQFAETRFSGGDGIFAGAKFSGMANFSAPQFERDANFNSAKFLRSASFGSAIFEREAKFQDCIFSSADDFGSGPRSLYAATFRQTQFYGDAIFSRSYFKQAATFSEVIFHKAADFHSIVSEVSLSLEGAVFSAAPDFVEARLHAPLRLDNVSIREAKPFLWRGNKEAAARYRALKRMASDAQDHLQELNLFASELRERRGSDLKPFAKGAASFWLGLIFEMLSDFGRSISRPLGWIFLTILAFCGLYGARVSNSWRTDCNWPSSWFSPELYLSILHTLPGLGVSHAGKRELALKCLYGTTKQGAPNIGPGSEVIFLAHNIWAAILLFLLFLAIRNLFRIR